MARSYGAGGAGFSALALAFLGLAATIPTLGAALFSGTLADRYDRRFLLKVVGAVSLGVTALIATTLGFDPSAAISAPGPIGFTMPVWLLLVFPLWAAMTAATTIYRPAFNASLPGMLETHLLGPANGLLYAVTVAVSAASQVLTGLLEAGPGPVVALLVPIALFAGSLAYLFLLGPSEAAQVPTRTGTFLSDAREGYRYLFQRRELLALTLGALTINFLSALAFVELAEYSTFYLGQDPSFLGYLYGVGTLGAGAGALAINQIPFERHLGRVAGALTVGMGVCITIFALTRSPILALLDMFLFGMFPGMFQIAFVAGVQATTPSRVLGRVFAADEVGSYAFVPVGQYAGGLLTYAAGIQATFAVAGAGTIATGAALLMTPIVGRFRFEPNPTSAGSAATPGGPAS